MRTCFVPLICPVKNYAWGNAHKEGLIRQLSRAGHLAPAPGEPTAELWMGTHPSGEALVAGTDRTLRQWIADAAGGPDLNSGLPFLFKILDAKSPLSIQAHPDKQKAVILHKKDPAHYPDDNHKPEMVVALSEVSALVGFRPEAEIESFVNKNPRVWEILFQDSYRNGSAPLALAFAALMKGSESQLETAAELLHKDIALQVRKTEEDELFLQFSGIYGKRDPGIFAPYLLNIIHLKPSEALFLGPNVPHAYLKGTMAECMANSDNVVRAGLTPKFKDVDTLLEILTYETGSPEILIPHGTGMMQHYPRCTDEFQIHSIQNSGTERLLTEAIPAPSLMVIIEGSLRVAINGEDSVTYTAGTVLYTMQCSEPTSRSIQCSSDLTAYIAST